MKTSILESHKGFLRNFDEFVKKAGLPAANWDPYLKKELFHNLDVVVFGRLGGGQVPFEKAKTARILMYEFDAPKHMKVTIDGLNHKNLLHRVILYIQYGQSMVSGIPHTVRRQARQSELIADVNEEPVIILEGQNGLSLYEGFHRTTEIASRAIVDALDDRLSSMGIDKWSLTDTELNTYYGSLIREIDPGSVPFDLYAYVGRIRKDAYPKFLSIFGSGIASTLKNAYDKISSKFSS